VRPRSGRVHYRELHPPPELRAWVHRVWVLRGPRGAQPAPFQRAMPDGRAELIFNLADRFESRGGGTVRLQPAVLLVGPSRRAMEIRPTGEVDLVGIRLRPEALSGWLRVRGEELVGRVCDMEPPGLRLDRTLPEQLSEIGDSTSRLAVLCRHLAAALPSTPADPRIARAVDLASAGGRARPAAIAREVGLSYRQLGRLFRERLGFGPKPLLRLGRFQRALRALESQGGGRLATVALQAGYYDQAHLGRDFRLFAGVTPGRYLRETRELTRHFIAEEAAGGMAESSKTAGSAQR
jgi:AraC-like DNA-binding protein